MPRYIIHCSSIKTYTLTVKAPSVEAVHSYYDRSDGNEFRPGAEGGWTLDDVEELPESTTFPKTDVTINKSGNVGRISDE